MEYDKKAAAFGGFDALLFDLFGTLVDTSSLARGFEEIGIAVDVKAFSEAWQSKRLQYMWVNSLLTKSSSNSAPVVQFQPFEKLSIRALSYTAKMHGINLSEDQIVRISESQLSLDILPDVRQGLEKVHSAGNIRMSALTNSSSRNTEKLLQKNGLDHYFEAVISAEDVRYYKPSPEPYYHAANVLKLPKSRLVMVSANLWDVAGAQNAGMKACWINREALLDIDQMDVRADLSFPSLIEGMQFFASASRIGARAA